MVSPVVIPCKGPFDQPQCVALLFRGSKILFAVYPAGILNGKPHAAFDGNLHFARVLWMCGSPFVGGSTVGVVLNGHPKEKYPKTGGLPYFEGIEGDGG